MRDLSKTSPSFWMPNRDKMVKHHYSLTEKISVPTQTDYKTVLSFYRVTTSNIEFAFGKSSKNIYYVRSLFPDEVKEVVADLILLSIRNIIEGEPSILKDRKRDRTLKWIEHLLNSELSSIKGKSELLQSRIDAVKGKLSDMTILKDSPPQLKIPYNWDFTQDNIPPEKLAVSSHCKIPPFHTHLASKPAPSHPPKFP